MKERSMFDEPAIKLLMFLEEEARVKDVIYFRKFPSDLNLKIVQDDCNNLIIREVSFITMNAIHMRSQIEKAADEIISELKSAGKNIAYKLYNGGFRAGKKGNLVFICLTLPYRKNWKIIPFTLDCIIDEIDKKAELRLNYKII